MRVVLIVPQSVRPFVGHRQGDAFLEPPMGALYLAAGIRELAEPVILDCQLERLSAAEAAERALAAEPDIVGLSVPFVSMLRNARAIGELVRQRAPAVRIVLGGNFATTYAAQLIRRPWVDAVVLKEADLSFPELLACYRDRGRLEPVTGTVVKVDGRTERRPFPGYVEDLDTLPFPAYDLLPARERYFTALVSSRGCPYECIYCSTRGMWGAWRPRSAANVLAELDTLLPDLPRPRINFADDNFTVSRQRVLEFVDGLEARGLPVAWGMSARIETVDGPLIDRLGAARCRNIFFGFESGSPRILKRLDRHYTPEEIERNVDRCIQAGIIPHASFMVGMPWEARQDVEATFALIARLNTPFVLISVFTPFAGTPVYEDPGRYGLTLLDPDLGEGAQIDTGRVVHRTAQLTAEEIKELWMEGAGLVVSRHLEREAYEEYVAQARGLSAKS